MQFEFTQDEALIAETFRRFADRNLRPATADADREAKIPAALLAQGVELGLYADAVPERAAATSKVPTPTAPAPFAASRLAGPAPRWQRSLSGA